MAALEAMAARIPVLLSPGCHLPQVDSVGAGFVVDATVDAVAEKLRLLLSDAEMRASMGMAGRRYVADNHSWDAVAARLEEVYAALLDDSDTRRC